MNNNCGQVFNRTLPRASDFAGYILSGKFCLVYMSGIFCPVYLSGIFCLGRLTVNISNRKIVAYKQHSAPF